MGITQDTCLFFYGKVTMTARKLKLNYSKNNDLNFSMIKHLTQLAECFAYNENVSGSSPLLFISLNTLYNYRFNNFSGL